MAIDYSTLPRGSGKILFEALPGHLRFCTQTLLRHGVDHVKLELMEPFVPEEPDGDYAIVKLPKDGKFREMAEMLHQMWPQGMREVNGRKYPWNDTVPNIESRLRKLWLVRGLDRYGVQDVRRVAEAYLSEHGDDARYMVSLKYWIMRTSTKDGVRQCTSGLADLLEDASLNDASVDSSISFLV